MNDFFFFSHSSSARGRGGLECVAVGGRRLTDAQGFSG